MPSTRYIAQRDSASRQVQWCVEIELDRCGNQYTQSPCAASDAGDGSRCRYSFLTCQDPTNYVKSSRVYRFHLNHVSWPDPNVESWPLLSRFVALPQKVNDRNLAVTPERVSVEFLRMQDPPPLDHDKGTGFFNTTNTGEFWTLLLAWNRNYVNRRMRIKRGFYADGFLLEDFEQIGPDYKITSVNAREQRVRITAESPLADIAKRKTPHTISSDNTIQDSGGINASVTTLTVLDASEFPDPSDYTRFKTYIKIDSEIMEYTARDTGANTLTIVRGSLNTTANTHNEGEKIVHTAFFGTDNGISAAPTGQNVTDTMRDLLEWLGIVEGSNQISNGDFEAWTASAPDDWTETETGGTVNEETDPLLVSGGTGSAARFDRTTTGVLRAYQATNSALTANRVGHIRVKAKTDATGAGVAGLLAVRIRNNTEGKSLTTDLRSFDTDSTTNCFEQELTEDYQTFDIYFRIPYWAASGDTWTLTVLHDAEATNCSMWVDDVEVYDDAQLNLTSFDHIKETLWVDADVEREANKPMAIAESLARLRELRGVMIHLDDMGLFTATYAGPSSVVDFAVDENKILLDSVVVDEDDRTRVSRVSLWWSPLVDNPGRKPVDYLKGSVLVDGSLEAANSFDDVRELLITDAWFDTNALASQARVIARRIIARRGRGTRRVTFQAEVKDSGINVGQHGTLSSDLVVGVNGTPEVRAVMIVSRKEITESRDELVALDTQYNGRYLRIAPDTVASTYDSASETDKTWGYWGDTDNRVGTLKEEGYIFI